MLSRYQSAMSLIPIRAHRLRIPRQSATFVSGTEVPVEAREQVRAPRPSRSMIGLCVQQATRDGQT
jgi:hypothetical protein